MPAKKRRCASFATSPSTSPGLKVTEPKNSVFADILRLASGVASSSSSSGSEGDASPPHHSHTLHTQKVHNKALFTFKQVRMICERMLREQEAALRAEYETALSNKLAEQYEAFVRFNTDQVQRRPPAATCMPLGMDSEHHMHQDLVPSYLS
ncbi:unnamed protein product [Leptidea sinapis]|uniref:Akirin n=1 Tax=Leptidea sinapis TaxID=189913 RepID=A0A5E4PRG8_9NEOP|nr:unnamed protein product [Leptidea sinapis]